MLTLAKKRKWILAFQKVELWVPAGLSKINNVGHVEARLQRGDLLCDRLAGGVGEPRVRSGVERGRSGRAIVWWGRHTYIMLLV